ncbi:MAG: 5'/3'-nucleotidase SurE [Alphaproteobacteria bacterium]|nr:5'/3'-nucleotidase SurE [Alphaproteobacteria bacterium]
MTNRISLPRILITNDDGYESEGLKVLAEIASSFTQELWVIAPDEEKSGMSQSVTLRKPVHIRKRKDRFWTVKGTPSDCVILALDYIMKETPPSLILSGVNAGLNTGDIANISGTVGAAMTALTFNVPAIAISQDVSFERGVRWDTTRAMLPHLLHYLLSEGWRKESCISVNIPNIPAQDIKGMRWTRQAQKNLRSWRAYRRLTPLRGEYFWIGAELGEPAGDQASDVVALERGEIALCALGRDHSILLERPFVSLASKDGGSVKPSSVNPLSPGPDDPF